MRRPSADEQAATVAVLQAELQKAKEQAASREEQHAVEKTELQQQLTDLWGHCADADAAAKTAEKKADEHASANAALQAQLAALQAQLAALQAQFAALQSQLPALQVDPAAAQKQSAAAEGEADAAAGSGLLQMQAAVLEEDDSEAAAAAGLDKEAQPQAAHEQVVAESDAAAGSELQMQAAADPAAVLEGDDPEAAVAAGSDQEAQQQAADLAAQQQAAAQPQLYELYAAEEEHPRELTAMLQEDDAEVDGAAAGEQAVGEGSEEDAGEDDAVQRSAVDGSGTAVGSSSRRHTRHRSSTRSVVAICRSGSRRTSSSRRSTMSAHAAHESAEACGGSGAGGSAKELPDTQEQQEAGQPGSGSSEAGEQQVEEDVCGPQLAAPQEQQQQQCTVRSSELDDSLDQPASMGGQPMEQQLAGLAEEQHMVKSIGQLLSDLLQLSQSVPCQDAIVQLQRGTLLAIALPLSVLVASDEYFEFAAGLLAEDWPKYRAAAHELAKAVSRLEQQISMQLQHTSHGAAWQQLAADEDARSAVSRLLNSLSGLAESITGLQHGQHYGAEQLMSPWLGAVSTTA
jgi:hypothetical protein